MHEKNVTNVTFKDQKIKTPCGEIYGGVWTHSPKNKKYPIILFHDSLGCVELWRDFPEKLALKTGRDVIVYDRLGFGKSEQRFDFPTTHFIEDEAKIILPFILEAFKVSQFIAFGHSVGGGMSVIIAGTWSEKCLAVISESAQAFVEDKTIEGIKSAQKSFENPKALARLEKYHGAKAKWVLSAWIDRWLSPEFKNWSLEKDLPRVKCPLFVIHGEKDDYGSLKFPEMIAGFAGGPTETLIVKDGGHVPHREKEAEILEAVDSFLGRNVEP